MYAICEISKFLFVLVYIYFLLLFVVFTGFYFKELNSAWNMRKIVQMVWKTAGEAVVLQKERRFTPKLHPGIKMPVELVAAQV